MAQQGNERERREGEPAPSTDNRPGYPGDTEGKSELGGHTDPMKPIPPSPNVGHEEGGAPKKNERA
ncbi:hypothetical protein [Polyangium spumosum]|uniref:Uncharacterized protein n=1 Tax=Polyangium spumosum TaxID=889282 RepID=A0A6N7PXA4_9BACT|nr:hypothetical protein [Polyangium spumosum]MRG96623.1 hypothetical protein [Polyangium spumosum]